MLNPAIFRKYDIRGLWNVDFDATGVVLLAHSLIVFLQKKTLCRQIVVGCDARKSSKSIKDTLLEALLRLGYDVIDLGLATTPMVNASYYLDPSCQIRIMITASHNPWAFNGFKIFFQDEAIWDDDLQTIAGIAQGQNFVRDAFDHRVGTLLKDEAFRIRYLYLDMMVEKFNSLNLNTSKPIIVDCMHGASGFVLHEIIGRLRLSKQLLLFRDEPFCDYEFIEDSIHAPDPTDLKNLTQTLLFIKEHNLDYALLFDGDADRFVVLHQSGVILKGEELLVLFIKSLKNKQVCVVTEVVASSVIDMVGAQDGFSVIRCPVGISNVKKTMKEIGAIIGGESSSHFLFYDDFMAVDDAVYAAYRFLKIINGGNVDLLQWRASLPQIIVSEVKKLFFPSRDALNTSFMASKNKLMYLADSYSEIDGIKGIFSGYDWILIRPSNTENCLVVRWQAVKLYDFERLSLIVNAIFEGEAFPVVLTT